MTVGHDSLNVLSERLSMVIEIDQWLSDKKTKNPANKASSQDDVVHFGYKKVPMEDKVNHVRGHFDVVAEKYDFMNSLLSFGIHHLWKRKAVRMLNLKWGDRVIDVCGGTGDLSLLAAKVTGPYGGVMLYDINRAMMKRGKSKVLKSFFSGDIHMVQGNAEQLSFPDRCFDAAMVGFGIRNLTHLASGLSEMYRVLRPGGKLMCLEFSKPTMPLFCRLYDFYSFHIMPFLGKLLVGSRQAYTYLPESIRLFPLPDELNHIFSEIGFSDIHYRRLTNGIAVIHLARKPA